MVPYRWRLFHGYLYVHYGGTRYGRAPQRCHKERDYLGDANHVPGICIRIVITTALPYLFSTPGAGLGYKVGFIFGSTSVLATIFAYFCFPECGGLSLEVINRLFNEEVSVRNFGRVGKEWMLSMRESQDMDEKRAVGEEITFKHA
ncbi:hypothetical protein F5Y15DRAFT_262680 [Xylariaceae sp. FL0016]|nr:hypothetical protein F5Y15DRAFT_262680 [Xylariaceae sp. FL0016]